MTNKNQSTEIKSTLLTRPEIAKHLRVCVLTIDRFLKNGTIPHYRIGRKVFFHLDKVMEAMAKNELK